MSLIAIQKPDRIAMTDVLVAAVAALAVLAAALAMNFSAAFAHGISARAVAAAVAGR